MALEQEIKTKTQDNTRHIISMTNPSIVSSYSHKDKNKNAISPKSKVESDFYIRQPPYRLLPARAALSTSINQI